MQQLEIFDSVHKTAPAEQAKLLAEALLEHELSLWRSGFKAIAGVDEAGRGPLAGPVVACACILPKGRVFHGVKDSKALKPDERKILANHLTSQPDIFWALGIVSSQVIDEINILRATLKAMREAVAALNHTPDFVLVDGRDKPFVDLPVRAIVRGDATSQSIAAASIIAKVHRDKMMERYHEEYPEYGFDKHKGYGTQVHMKAIEKYGHARSIAKLLRLSSKKHRFAPHPSSSSSKNGAKTGPCVQLCNSQNCELHNCTHGPHWSRPPLVTKLCLRLFHAGATSQSIAAASIIAKVHRDKMMERYHEEYPEYSL